MSSAIRLGTRRSALATAQSQQTADALAAVAGRRVELVPITSEGDVSRASLSQLGGQGVFATRLREALLAGECDLLVHSLKDLPTAPAPGLVIAAIPEREDARDIVLTRDGTPLHELHAGAVVGTGSPRRIAQISTRNPRVETRDLRGNIDSRMGRVREGELDAVILAAAGLARIGGVPADLVAEPLGLAEWPTAPGQGALAVEARDDAPAELRDAIARLDDLATRVAVTAERAVLSGLDAGCHAPVGVYAQWQDESLRIRAVVYAPDGSRRLGLDRTVLVRGGYAGEPGSGNGADAAGDDGPVARARRTGDGVARELLDHGAAEVAP
ncbi:hydroxymethylbilane synthase [Microbacterium sp. 18062]|uniref:hydroxymethylbilane synthase n=1 Tax=Microbacterium sp. 18062 TaxID=2681410 RepID=UPI00135A38D3|nr:hydroxymethylbilane synthase [Microbacterium sp. 18062]